MNLKYHWQGFTHRTANRFKLALWAFRNPDSITMLRHELWTASRERNHCGKRNADGSIEWKEVKGHSAIMCEIWLKHFFGNLSVK